MIIRFKNQRTWLPVLGLLVVLAQVLWPAIPKFRFEHLSTAQGLSHNTVIEILQDKQGFLWIGTLNGLDRYDGYRFTAYQPVSGDTTSLCNNVINALYEDPSGNLWIGTLNGLNQYDRSRDQFIQFQKNKNNENSLIDNRIRCISGDYTGKLWIGTEGGLSCFDPVSEKFTNYTPEISDERSLSDYIIHDIFEDSRRQLWIATEGGINRFNRNSQNFTHFPHESQNSVKYGIGASMCINEDKWGNIWVGTWGDGLQRKELNASSFRRVTQNSGGRERLDSDIITGLLIDSADRMWICTYDNGLYVMPQIPRNPAATGIEDLQHYTYDSADDHGIQSNAIWFIYMDRTGVVWIGNESGGLNKCDTKQSNILHYQSNKMVPNSLTNNQVTSFFEDKNGLVWIGTRFGGLNCYDPGQESFTSYRYSPDQEKGISSDAILSLEGNDHYLWIGTDGNGLDRLDLKSGEVWHFLNHEENDSSISANNIWSLCLDSRERLWAGTWGGGLARLNEDGLSFTNYPVDQNNIRTNVVTSIAEDTSGTLWLGTYGKGLVYFDPDKEKMLYFQHDDQKPASIGHNNINTIFVDHQGTLWISTMGAGINYLEEFNPETETAVFGKIDKKDGLPDNIIECISEDNEGFFWMGTSHGIARLNPKNSEVRNFSSSDGFGQDVFNHGATLRTGSGLLYFGGTKGFNVFHPANLSYNSYIPSVAITQFQIFNDPVPPKEPEGKLEKSILIADKINLTHRDNVFSFEFAALDFSCPGKNQYAYKMEGFDHDWRTTGADRRFITYTNLPHGKYTFKVIASNNHGQWNKTGASVDIIIAPPFWKTNWMLAIYILLILGAILLIRVAVLIQERNRGRIEMERLKAEKTHEIDQLKLRFFTHISHEFRTPLTLIIGPVERMLKIGAQISQEKRDIYNRMVLQNARRLLRLINQLMDARKLDTGSMKLELQEKEFITFARAVFSVFHHHADEKRIDYTFDSEIDSLCFAFDPDKIEKVLINLISNALKFTDTDGTIKVSMGRLPAAGEGVEFHNRIFITVKDSGIGITRDQIEHIFDPFYQVSVPVAKRHHGSGIGLSITKDFVEMHGGTITVESEPDKGSCFTVFVPERHLDDARLPETINRQQETTSIEMDLSEDAMEIDCLQPHESDGGKPLILTVEDDKDLRQYLTMEIEDKYTIIQAQDGLSGYEMAVERIPDLIISDVMMNVMDGYEFCNHCKSDQRTSHIPIILLTAHTADEMRKKGFQSGADDFIIKPFNPDMLKLRIDNLLETRQKLRERFSKMIYANPKDIPISSPDEQFLNKILETVENYISDTGFSVDDLSYQVGLSRAQLYRKMQGLFNYSPSDFIKNYRLQRAMKFLEKGHSPSQVCYKVGFRDPSYFSKCFKKEFGQTPQQILIRDDV